MSKLKSFILTISLFGIIGQIKAQVLTEKEIHNAIEMANIEYKTFVGHSLSFSDSESKDFWEITNIYLVEKEKIWSKEILLYAKDYTDLNDVKSKEFLKQTLKIEHQNKRLKNKFFRKLSKVLPVKKYLRFIQVDHYIESARSYLIAAQSPWIKSE